MADVEEIQGKKQTAAISYRQECYRKAIHLSALSIPLLYALTNQGLILLILVPTTILVVVLDYARYHPGKLRALAEAVFGNMLREHEKNIENKHLSGASYVLLAATASILFFPKIIALIAFTVLVVSDTAAALIGRKYGKHKLLDKSIEGTLAFIVSGIIVVMVVGIGFGNTSGELYAFGTVAVVMAAIVELASKRYGIDDNLSIPLTVGGIMLVLGLMAPEAYLAM